MEKSTRESTRNAKFNLSEATKLSYRQRSVPTSLSLSLFLFECLASSSCIKLAPKQEVAIGADIFLAPLKSGSTLRKTFRQSFIWIEPGSRSYWFYFSDNVVDRIIAIRKIQSFGTIKSYKETYLYSFMINANPKN